MVRSGVIISIICISTGGCRVRNEGARVQDLTPIVNNASGGLELELNARALRDAKLAFSQRSGKIEFWSMASDPAIEKKLQGRLGSFKMHTYNMVSSAEHSGRSAEIKKYIAPKTLSFSGVPGNDPGRTIFLKEKTGTTLVLSDDLAGNFFANCPSDYFKESGKLPQILRNNRGVPPFVIEEDAGPTVNKVIYRPNGIKWVLSCAPVISWPDIPESKLLAKLSFEVELSADRVIFPGAASDPKYPSIRSDALVSEGNGFGTRFFKDYNSVDPEKSNVQRWNPLRSRLVIDDMKDDAGSELGSSEYGRWIQEALKIATADLRIKIPQLGNKIVLTSEQPQFQPDIVFSRGDAMGVAARSITLLDDKNGEIRQARISVGGESDLAGRIKMIDEFYKVGLIDDPKRSYHDSFLTMVIHELGHALGLRHNFSGYGLNKNWGNDLQATMSYAMIGFPLEFVSDKVEWKPHDILSLKILYADLAGPSQQSRPALIAEVLKYPLSQDEMGASRPYDDMKSHFEASLHYLEITNQPKMAKFRDSNPDWKTQIKAIYKNAYDVSMD